MCPVQLGESVGHDEKVSELQHQNEELRRVIRHMRRDIETLGNQTPASVPVGDQVPAHTNSSLLPTVNNGL